MTPSNPTLDKAIEALDRVHFQTHSQIVHWGIVKAAAKRTAELERELLKWKEGCERNADCLREALRLSDERRLENLSLKSIAEKMLEALMLEASYIRSQGYSTTHPVRLRIEKAIALAQAAGIGKEK